MFCAVKAWTVDEQQTGLEIVRRKVHKRLKKGFLTKSETSILALPWNSWRRHMPPLPAAPNYTWLLELIWATTMSLNARAVATEWTWTMLRASQVGSLALLAPDHRLDDIVGRVIGCMLGGSCHLFAFQAVVELLCLGVLAILLSQSNHEVLIVGLESLLVDVHFWWWVESGD